MPNKFYYSFEAWKLVPSGRSDISSFLVIDGLIATIHIFKRTRNLNLFVIGCWVIATGSKLKKSLN